MKRKCKKGKSCGLSCISENRTCRKEFSEEVSESLDDRSAILPERKKVFDKGREKIDPILEKAREAMVNEYGVELVRAAEENIGRLLEEAELEIRVHNADIMIMILEDRFKTQFETGTSRGVLNTEARAVSEERVLGLPKDLDARDRPIYGAFNSPGEKSGASGYGGVIVNLKEEVKERTTVTGNDSMYAADGASRLPPQFQLPALFRNLTPSGPEVLEALANAKSLGDITFDVLISPYIEAQIHGQVLPEDIKSISFPELRDEKQLARLTELTDALGIELTIGN